MFSIEKFDEFLLERPEQFGLWQIFRGFRVLKNSECKLLLNFIPIDLNV